MAPLDDPPMQLAIPFVLYDTCLDHQLATLAFDRFLLDLPGISRSTLCVAFEHLVTMLRYPYRDALKVLQKQKESEVARLTTVIRFVEEVRRREIENLKISHRDVVGNLINSHTTKVKALKESHNKEVEIIKTANKELSENLKSQMISLQRQFTDLLVKSDSDYIPRSSTRSEVWANVKNANRDKIDLPLSTIFPSVLSPVEVADIIKLTNNNYPAKVDMYTPVTTLLSQLLNAPRTGNSLGTSVLDTHTTRYLGVYAPDITFAVGGLLHPDSASIYAVLELKHCSVPIDASALGQAYGYMLATRQAQPHRRCIAAVVSNLLDTQVLLYDTKDSSTRHFKATDFAHAVSWIKTVILVDPTFAPSVPPFSLSLGPMIRRLGYSSHSVVCEFAAPTNPTSRIFASESLGSTIAVKRSSNAAGANPSDIESEIQILTLIKFYGGHKNLPRIIHSTLDLTEIGICPVGKPIDAQNISEYTAHTILVDVLSGLVWLHSKDILHRDVRLENVILHQGHARLIDLGAALKIPASDHDTERYYGGYLCCPRELIGDFKKPYHPKKSDDLLAYVMMACFLTRPQSLRGLTSNKVGERGTVAERLAGFWARMEKSRVWKVFVDAAVKEDIGVLEGVRDVFIMV